MPDRGYFNDTPVEILRHATLGGERCVLVKWPNGDRSWRAQDEIRNTPKSEARP